MAQKKFKIADLRCLVEVFSRTRMKDSIGGFSTEWVSRGQTWALIEDISKGESFRAARAEALVGQRVIIRKGSMPAVEAASGEPPVPYTSGYLLVTLDVPLTDASDSTGLANDETTFENNFSVDGTGYPISVVGHEAQTYGALIALIEAQAPVTGSIVDGKLVFTSQTTGIGSSVVPGIGNDDTLLIYLASWSSTQWFPGAGSDGTAEVPGWDGLTADCVIKYDGRTMPIKVINNITEGRVEYQELITVQGDPTGPGL